MSITLNSLFTFLFTFQQTPSNKRTYVSPFMFIIFYFLFLCVLKIAFSSKYCKYVILPGVSYGTWNSSSGTFFAKNMTILLTRSGDKKRLRLGCEKKLVALKWTNSNLDGPIYNLFWFHISATIIQAATTVPEPDIGFSSCFA